MNRVIGDATSRDRAPTMTSAAAAAEPLYGPLASVYDVLYGIMLQPGRRRAMQRLAPRPGERLLEVGVGTGWSAESYPRDCRVTGIDLSAPMVAQAQRRIRRKGITQMALCRMDATRLAFANETFDAVYAPYVVNVVPDPIVAAREMLRVCRPGGRIVFLNHFSRRGELRAVDRFAGLFATRISGVNWALDLDAFVGQAGLVVDSLEAVNLAGVSSLLVCRKPQRRMRSTSRL